MPTQPKSPLRWVTHIIRTLMGLFFFVTAVAFLLNMFPEQPMPPFGIALRDTHYMLQFIKITEALFGLLLIINRFVPFALVMIAPVMLNIIAYQIFLDHTGLPVVLILFLLYAYLIYAYRRYYVQLFTLHTPLA